jgi:hypothetical protein
MSGDDVTVLAALEAVLDGAADPQGSSTPPPGSPAVASVPARQVSATAPRAASGPAGDRSMAPQERAFRDAMAGGVAQPRVKRAPTVAERAALRSGLGNR